MPERPHVIQQRCHIGSAILLHGLARSIGMGSRAKDDRHLGGHCRTRRHLLLQDKAWVEPGTRLARKPFGRKKPIGGREIAIDAKKFPAVGGD
jgi:hypothetical protein